MTPRRRVYFVDDDPACVGRARRTSPRSASRAEAVFVRARAAAGSPRGDLDLCWRTPPYGPLDLAALLDGLVAARGRRVRPTHRAPAGWEATNERYGTTLVTMLEPDDGR